MKINIQNNGIRFSSVSEGELFVKGNSLLLKRYHHSVGEEYQAIRVGVTMGGLRMAPDEVVQLVTEVSIKL